MDRHHNRQQTLTPEQAATVLENCKTGLVDESIPMKDRQSLLRSCESALKKNAAAISPDDRKAYLDVVRQAKEQISGEKKEEKEVHSMLRNSASLGGKKVTQIDLMEGKGALTLGFKGSLVKDAKGMLAEAGIIPAEWMDRKLKPDVYDIGTVNKVKEFQSTPEFKAANPTTPANGQFDKATMDFVAAKIKAANP